MSELDQFISRCASECVNAERDQDFTSLKRRYTCRTCGCPCDLQADQECPTCSKRPDAQPLSVDEHLRCCAVAHGNVVALNLPNSEATPDELYRSARQAAHWARLLLLYCEQDKQERIA